MSALPELAQLNVDTAERLVTQEFDFDDDAAEAVVQNLVLATGRLSTEQFKKLSPHSLDAIFKTVNFAKESVFLGDIPSRQYSDELTPEYHLRVGIQEPLTGLERGLRFRDFDEENYVSWFNMRMGVLMAGVAFSSLAGDPAAKPSMLKNEPTFRDNISFAANRVGL